MSTAVSPTRTSHHHPTSPESNLHFIIKHSSRCIFLRLSSTSIPPSSASTTTQSTVVLGSHLLHETSRILNIPIDAFKLLITPDSSNNSAQIQPNTPLIPQLHSLAPQQQQQSMHWYPLYIVFKSNNSWQTPSSPY